VRSRCSRILPAGHLRDVEYSHRIWRIEDGLPQNKIQAIAQTPDGYLWVGTSEGLARFDGVRFHRFRPLEHTPRSRTTAFLR